MTRRDVIALSITEGRTVRDLFCNGLLDMIRDEGFDVSVFTEAANVQPFIDEWSLPGVSFEPFVPTERSGSRLISNLIRSRIARVSRAASRSFDRAARGPSTRSSDRYLEVLRRIRPRAYLATHAHLYDELGLTAAARSLDIPTLGLIRSWDNVHKGIHVRPDRLLVWNEINRQEVIRLEGFRPDAVDVVGAPQFDPYFDPATRWPREDLAARFGLDPGRPIILFATLGYFIPGFDETSWMDSILDLLDAGSLPGRPQVICRLHPWSRLEHFERYATHPDVRLSYVSRYWPGLQWTMTREDVVEVANMLIHADVVITPGSTITLEAAAFDRPTIVPVFHRYQPERAEEYFSTWVLGKHFGRIRDLDLVPIIKSEQDFEAAIRRCLEDPAWYRAGRERLVSDYLAFTDGRSTERIAQYVVRAARSAG